VLLAALKHGVDHGQHSTAAPCPTIACTVLLQDGDHVVYSKFAGTDLEVGGVEHVLLKVRINSSSSRPPG
jgi:hypothetical protein